LICALLNPHFITSLDSSIFHKHCKITKNKAFINHNGDYETRIGIDSVSFARGIVNELTGVDEPSFSDTIKIIFAIYNNVLGKKYDHNEEYWIFYHMHQTNYHLNTLDNLMSNSDFKRLEYLFIIREPVQHLFSCINFFSQMEGYFAAMISTMNSLKNFICSDLGYMFEKKRSNFKKNVKVVRFEDLKLRSKETMLAFCKWADIEYSDSMTETTVNGIKVYLTTVTDDGKKRYITGNDPYAVNRKDFSSQMTSYDIVRLNIAFQKFKKAYGYEVDVPDFKDFSKGFLNEMYSKDFKFVRTLIDSADKTGDITNSKNILSEGIKHLLLTFMGNYEENTEYYDYFKVET